MIYLVLIVLAALNSLFAVALVRAVVLMIFSLAWTGKFYFYFKFSWPYQSPVNWLHIAEILLISLLVRFLFKKFFNKNIKYWLVLGLFVLVHLLIVFVPSLFIKIVDKNALSPNYQEQSFDFNKEAVITDNTGRKNQLHIYGNKIFWVQNMALSLSPRARSATNGLTRDLLVFEFDESTGRGKIVNLTNGDGDVAAENVMGVGSKIFWVWDDGKYHKNVNYYDFASKEKGILVSDIISLYRVASDFLLYHKKDPSGGKYNYFLYSFGLAKEEQLKEAILDDVAASGDGNYACYESEKTSPGLTQTDLIRYDLVKKEKKLLFTGSSKDLESVKSEWCGEKYVAYRYKSRDSESIMTKVLNIDTGKVVFDRDIGVYRAGMKLIGDDLYFSEGGDNNEIINKIIYKYNLVDQSLGVLYKREEGIANWDTDGKYLVFVAQGKGAINHYDTGALYLVPIEQISQNVMR
ncbi:hypothetical protein KBC97_00645 [Candidatus Gracilibacteria bacterium]|nr:hypothetical protein [Candidatus Gracilibacteria bacterium]